MKWLMGVWMDGRMGEWVSGWVEGMKKEANVRGGKKKRSKRE